ncbi:MAG: acylphosphatase [Bacteroidia bacterium]|nr:acylphosphatase [Bacteroidia bacterium]
MKEAYDIEVYGRVQGVFFRAFTQKKAHELNLTGYVMNRHDGSVFIHAEGDWNQLQKFLDWCAVGSPKSKVEKVEYKNAEIKNFKTFEIRRV